MKRLLAALLLGLWATVSWGQGDIQGAAANQGDTQGAAASQGQNSGQAAFPGGEFLPLKGVVNARDMGGYIMKDGRKIKPGMLIRSAALAGAQDEDLSYLSGVPVKKVIDFRVELEKRGKADRMVPGAEYICLPIKTMDDKDAPEELARIKSFEVSRLVVLASFNGKAKSITRKLYVSMISNAQTQQQYAAFLQEVVRSGDGAVLFHCTQGKDRSGLAAAFLLSALGADKKTIVHDFDLTNLVYEKDLRKYSRKVRSLGGGEEELEALKAMVGANTERFSRALDYIDETYGSMKSYLTGPLRLSEKDIRTLQERYLE